MYLKGAYLNCYENLTLSLTYLNDLIIAAKHRFGEHLSLAASIKCFLISMAKVFLLSKLLQQSTQLQVFFPLDGMCKIIMPVMPSFYRNKFIKMIGS